MIAVLKDIEEIDAETSEDCNPQCIVAQWSLDINVFQQNLFAASGGPPPGEFSFGDSQVLATFFDDHTTVATFDVHGHGVADVGGGTLEMFVDLAGGGSEKLDPRRHHAVGLERELRHPGHDPRFFNGDPVVDDPLVLDPNSSGAVGNSTFEVACDDEAGRLLMTWVDPASGVKAEMPYIRIGDYCPLCCSRRHQRPQPCRHSLVGVAVHATGVDVSSGMSSGPGGIASTITPAARATTMAARSYGWAAKPSTATTGRGVSTAASRPKASSINCPPLHRYGSSYVSMPASTASSHVPMAAFDPGVTGDRHEGPLDVTAGAGLQLHRTGRPATDQIVVHGMRDPAGARPRHRAPRRPAVGSSTAAPTSNSASVVRRGPRRTGPMRCASRRARGGCRPPDRRCTATARKRRPPVTETRVPP